MKRRRIREIVAASLEDYTSEPTRPDQITVTVQREAEAERRVEVGVLWGFIVAATKREALRLSLAAHGWEREWPRKIALEVLQGFVGAERGVHPALWLRHVVVMAHLREPVALPEEASRG